MSLFESATWVPAGIFLAEMCVVTIGTLRIIFIARGHRLLAPLLGFFEILIWLFAISQIMRNLSDPWCFAAFAAGFTCGNFLGMLIERRLAMGMAIVRIFTNRDPANFMAELRTANMGYTCINGEGATGPVRIVMTVVKRRQLPILLTLIDRCQPKAFYAIDDLQSASQGIFPLSSERGGFLMPSLRWFGGKHAVSELASQERTAA